MKRFHWYLYVGLDLFRSLFQSPPCRYLQRSLLFLCPMQLHGFEDNCFHWTQVSFLSLRIRPSISWVGPGYNYTESSSSHQCVRILSCHLVCSNNLFYLLQSFFICSNFILFAATFLFAACPLWATVLLKHWVSSLQLFQNSTWTRLTGVRGTFNYRAGLNRFRTITSSCSSQSHDRKTRWMLMNFLGLNLPGVKILRQTRKLHSI